MSDSSVSSSQAAGIEYVDWPVLGNEEPLPDDPMIALDKLTQLNGTNASAGAHACGAVSLVGAMLAVHGYAGLRSLAHSLANELSDETRDSLERLAEEIGATLLAQIPIEPAIAFGGEAGTPVVESNPQSPHAQAFFALAAQAALRASQRSATGPKRSSLLRTVD